MQTLRGEAGNGGGGMACQFCGPHSNSEMAFPITFLGYSKTISVQLLAYPWRLLGPFLVSRGVNHPPQKRWAL